MDTSSSILLGRPFGGTGFLWHKRLAPFIKFKTFDDPRLIGLEVNMNNTNFIILNIYMPTDLAKNLDEFCSLLGKIQSITEESDTNCYLTAGDFNADVSSGSFYKELRDYATKNSLFISDTLSLPADEFTFISLAHGTTSWLDHILSSRFMHEKIKDIKILHGLIGSDHCPLQFSLDVGKLPTFENIDCEKKTILDWSRLSDADVMKYTNDTDRNLRSIVIPNEAILCENPNLSLIHI